MTMAGSGAGAIALGLAGGYLLGSIPFGLVLTRFAGLGDIRRVGSGNIGANTSAARSLWPPPVSAGPDRRPRFCVLIGGVRASRVWAFCAPRACK